MPNSRAASYPGELAPIGLEKKADMESNVKIQSLMMLRWHLDQDFLGLFPTPPSFSLPSPGKMKAWGIGETKVEEPN